MYNTDLPNRAALPTSRQLAKSTLIAAGIALLLLLGIVMPAEYGLDPIGTGKLTGLQKMGEIKTSLAKEAAQDRLADTAAAAPSTPAVAAAKPASAAPPSPATSTAQSASAAKRASDRMTVTLQPGQAAEVKLAMVKDALANFEWTSSGPVNFDNHGDPTVAVKGFYHGYGKGRQVQQDKGVIQAAFDGRHGFFWRNRGSGPVTIELKTEGDYASIKRVL